MDYRLIIALKGTAKALFACGVGALLMLTAGALKDHYHVLITCGILFTGISFYRAYFKKRA